MWLFMNMFFLTIFSFFPLGAVKPQELDSSDISIHYSTTVRKSILHHIITRQNSIVSMRLALHYYAESPKSDQLYYCDENVKCSIVTNY